MSNLNLNLTDTEIIRTLYNALVRLSLNEVTDCQKILSACALGAARLNEKNIVERQKAYDIMVTDSSLLNWMLAQPAVELGTPYKADVVFRRWVPAEQARAGLIVLMNKKNAQIQPS